MQKKPPTNGYMFFLIAVWLIGTLYCLTKMYH